MPTQEEVEKFFMDFAKEMEKEGLHIMDSYTENWPDLPTTDEVRDAEVEQQDDKEDDREN
jgi:hypothetical protein